MRFQWWIVPLCAVSWWLEHVTVCPQGALTLNLSNLAEANKTIALLDARIRDLMDELVKRQHRHSDVGGMWEGAWMPRSWTGEGNAKAWKPAVGAPDAVCVDRWSCCGCTNRYSHFCKPVCGCEDFTGRFCKAPPCPDEQREY